MIPPLRGVFEHRWTYDIDYLEGDCHALLCNIFTSVCLHKFYVLVILRIPAKIWTLKLNNECL